MPSGDDGVFEHVNHTDLAGRRSDVSLIKSRRPLLPEHFLRGDFSRALGSASSDGFLVGELRKRPVEDPPSLFTGAQAEIHVFKGHGVAFVEKTDLVDD